MAEAIDPRSPKEKAEQLKRRVATDCADALKELGFPQFAGTQKAAEALSLQNAYDLVVGPYQQVMKEFYKAPVDLEQRDREMDSVDRTHLIVASQAALDEFTTREELGKPNAQPNELAPLTVRDMLAVGCVAAGDKFNDDILAKAKTTVASSPTAMRLQTKLTALPPMAPTTK